MFPTYEQWIAHLASVDPALEIISETVYNEEVRSCLRAEKELARRSAEYRKNNGAALAKPGKGIENLLRIIAT